MVCLMQHLQAWDFLVYVVVVAVVIVLIIVVKWGVANGLVAVSPAVAVDRGNIIGYIMEQSDN